MIRTASSIPPAIEKDSMTNFSSHRYVSCLTVTMEGNFMCGFGRALKARRRLEAELARPAAPAPDELRYARAMTACLEGRGYSVE